MRELAHTGARVAETVGLGGPGGRDLDAGSMRPDHVGIPAIESHKRHSRRVGAGEQGGLRWQDQAVLL